MRKWKKWKQFKNIWSLIIHYLLTESEVNKLFILRLFALFMQAYSRAVGITEE